jgi:hypothetical protein
MTERRDGRDGPAFGTGPGGWREQAATSGPGPESSGGTMRRDVVRRICEEVITDKDTDCQATLAVRGVALAVILPEVLDELERAEAENGRLTRDVGGAVGRVLEDMEQLVRERDRFKAGLEMVAQIIHGSTRQTKSIADAVLGGADPNDPRFIEVF